MGTDQRLNQVIAVESGVKSRTEATITSLYHTVQKSALFDGMSRTYKPLKEGAERLPPEVKVVQQRARDVIKDATQQLVEWFDLVAAKDFSNCNAKADVLVDGKVLLPEVPATYLLFLEKRLTDFHTLLSKLPTLDPAEVWVEDANDHLYKTSPTETARTAKIPRALVKYPATTEHPAQTEVFNEDVIIGYYEATKMSGAIPLAEQQRLLRKVETLQKAVKFARDTANMTPAPPRLMGSAIFEWVLSK